METATVESPLCTTAECRKEHIWLQRFVGEWTSEAEMSMEPGEPAEKASGTESVRSIGGLWVIAEGRGEMPDGSPAIMITTLGYDPQKQRFVGTFIGSMMTHLWVYEGELSPDERVLALNTEGPTMGDEGKMARFQDIVEFENDDHRTLKSQMLGDDGEWHEVMRAEFWRKK
jgi:hypothetical protein